MGIDASPTPQHKKYGAVGETVLATNPPTTGPTIDPAPLIDSKTPMAPVTPPFDFAREYMIIIVGRKIPAEDPKSANVSAKETMSLA